MKEVELQKQGSTGANVGDSMMMMGASNSFQSNERPKEYYEYNLRGVVMHSGTAEYGHYYSYINIEDDKWLEFNDSSIREFDKQSLESECFGGNSNNNCSGNNGGYNNMNNNNDDFYQQKGGEYSKNAYILVYERKTKDPLKIVFESEEQKKEIARTLDINLATDSKTSSHKVLDKEVEKEEQVLLVDYYKINKCNNKPKLNFIVWYDNHSFMLEKHVYSEEFFYFVD